MPEWLFAELKGSVKNHQGFVDKTADNFERAVSAAHPSLAQTPRTQLAGRNYPDAGRNTSYWPPRLSPIAAGG